MASSDTFTAEVPRQIIEDSNFRDWEDDLDGSLFGRVEAAREKIESEGLITSVKDLGDGLYEKKWNSGLRLYFAVIEEGKEGRTLLLLGSGKGSGQDRAIKRSRQSMKRYRVFRGSIKKVDLR